MKWENLKLNKCPYDFGTLEENPLDYKFYFTTSKFNIDFDRKTSIEIHKGNPAVGVIQQIKWQRLKEERCPLCSSDLSYGIGAYDILTCIDANCTFKIRHDRFVEILADKTHPCNIFFQKEKMQKHNLDEE